MTEDEYILDPCRASSLPFWKTLQVQIPEGISIFRNDEYTKESVVGVDEPYFKLIHYLKEVDVPSLPPDYVLTNATEEEFVAHIKECYQMEGISISEIIAYKERPVYDPNLWIAIREQKTGKIVASGIGERDKHIGEGTLEWIQVSLAYRHKGLGKYVVSELLARLRDRAEFVTVSGKVNNPSNPYELYITCGFSNPVIWHIVSWNS